MEYNYDVHVLRDVDPNFVHMCLQFITTIHAYSHVKRHAVETHSCTTLASFDCTRTLSICIATDRFVEVRFSYHAVWQNTTICFLSRFVTIPARISFGDTPCPDFLGKCIIFVSKFLQHGSPICSPHDGYECSYNAFVSQRHARRELQPRRSRLDLLS